MGDWDSFIDSCPEATFFHRAGWKRIIEESFQQKAHYLYVENDRAIRGVLPLIHMKSPLFGNRLVANAYCVAGAPAVTDTQALTHLDRRAEALMNELGADYLEYRNPARPHQDWEWKEGLYATFERPIDSGEDADLKQIPRKQRAVVRKALKSELSFGIDTDVTDFFNLFALSVRNLGTPVFSRRYFENLVRVFGDDCNILTVRLNGRPISSVLNFYFRDRVMPYYTGSIAEARKLGANDFMYWKLMRHAAERGYKIFDFGRSKVRTGPYAFKKNWGFEPRPIIHEFKMRAGVPMPDVNPNNPKYRLMIAAWKRLPLPVANIIGPFIGRQVG